MINTTKLNSSQIPELEDLYRFDDLGGRPKYGGVEMTSETDIPALDVNGMTQEEFNEIWRNS